MGDWLNQVEFWHWMSFGFLLLILEMVAPSTLFLWMGVSALVVAVVQWIFPEIPWAAQFIIFGLMSLVSFFGWRAFSKKRGLDNADEEYSTLNKRSASLIGRRAVLNEALTNGYGRIQLDDTIWRIEGEDAEVGTKVRVVDVKGATLIVAIDNKATNETRSKS